MGSLALRSTLLSVLGGGLLLIQACGDSARTDGYDTVPIGSDDSTLDASASGSSGNSSGNSSGGSSSSSGNVIGTDSGPVIVDAGDQTCAAEVQNAKQIPLDLIVMLDTSGSMGVEVSPKLTKYRAVKEAFVGFLNDPKSDNLGFGLQFFPNAPATANAVCTTKANCPANQQCMRKGCTALIGNPFGGNAFCDNTNDCSGILTSCVQLGACAQDKSTLCTNVGQGCGKDPANFDLGTCNALATARCTSFESCNAIDYAKLTAAPAVDVQVLPAGKQAIKDALNARTMEGLTPTSAALQGAVDAAKSHAFKNPTHTVVVVFATDGLPTLCVQDTNAIKSIAAGALASTPSIKTFVLGVFPQEEQAQAKPLIDAIAQGGGTTPFLVTANSQTTQQFLTALNAIRGEALPCEYAVPVPEAGTPDYGKVNVQYVPSPSATPVPITYHTSAAGCGTGPGWYYDVDPSQATPKKILLCKNSCDTVKAGGAGSKVDVLLGCKTNGKVN